MLDCKLKRASKWINEKLCFNEGPHKNNEALSQFSVTDKYEAKSWSSRPEFEEKERKLLKTGLVGLLLLRFLNQLDGNLSEAATTQQQQQQRPQQQQQQ